MQWIFEHFYIVAIVGYFILSLIGKVGKSSTDQKTNRMPTFGGGNDSTSQGPRPVSSEAPSQPVRRVQTRPSTATSVSPAEGNRSQERLETHQVREFNPYYQEQMDALDLDNETSFDMFSNQSDPHEERDSMEQRKRNMQAQLDQIHKHLDRMTSHIPETILEVTDTEGNAKHQQSKFAKQAVNGVIWSEILGPPRSKRPMGRR